jgi:hypothetical protein
MPNMIHEQLGTAALIRLIAAENDPTERQRLRVQLGFTEIVDRLLIRAENHEQAMAAKYEGHEERLDVIEPVVKKHDETIISWKANLRLLVLMFSLFNTGIGYIVYQAWEITTTMYQQVKELGVVIPAVKTIKDEAIEQTRTLTETKKAIETNKTDITEQLDNSRFNDERLDELNKEIERIKKLKAVRGSR